MDLKGLCPYCAFAVPVVDGALAPHLDGACAGIGADAAEAVRHWVDREVANARLMLASAPARRLLLAADIARAQADLATHDAGVGLARRTLDALEPLLPARPGPANDDEGPR